MSNMYKATIYPYDHQIIRPGLSIVGKPTILKTSIWVTEIAQCPKHMLCIWKVHIPSPAYTVKPLSTEPVVTPMNHLLRPKITNERNSLQVDNEHTVQTASRCCMFSYICMSSYCTPRYSDWSLLLLCFYFFFPLYLFPLLYNARFIYHCLITDSCLGFIFQCFTYSKKSKQFLLVIF